MARAHVDRNRLIFEKRLNGATYRELGKIYGLSACRVMQIVNAETRKQDTRLNHDGSLVEWYHYRPPDKDDFWPLVRFVYPDIWQRRQRRLKCEENQRLNQQRTAAEAHREAIYQEQLRALKLFIKSNFALRDRPIFREPRESRALPWYRRPVSQEREANDRAMQADFERRMAKIMALKR